MYRYKYTRKYTAEVAANWLKPDPHFNPNLASTLKRAGFKVHDETLAVTVIFDD